MQGTVSYPTGVRAEKRTSRLPDGLRLAALVALLVGLGAAGTALERPLAIRGNERVEQDGAGWEGRRLIAQMLWLKTHAVLHAGVEEREARPGEEASRAAEVHRHGGDGGQAEEAGKHAEHPGHRDGDAPEEHSEHPGHEACAEHEEHAAHAEHEEHADHAEHPGHEACEEHGEHHGAYVLAIPPAREDFRGILGDLERAVEPYLDANGKLPAKDADQTIPFYRLVTWSDPHFVQGYTVGATMICRAGQYPERGLEFLLEGERHNPASFEIQTELGHFYLVYRKEYGTAERHLRRALALIPRRELSELEQDAQADAYRWLALTYREMGRPEQAMAVAREGLRVIGADASLELMLKHRGRKPAS